MSVHYPWIWYHFPFLHRHRKIKTRLQCKNEYENLWWTRKLESHVNTERKFYCLERSPDPLIPACSTDMDVMKRKTKQIIGLVLQGRLYYQNNWWHGGTIICIDYKINLLNDLIINGIKLKKIVADIKNINHKYVVCKVSTAEEQVIVHKLGRYTTRDISMTIHTLSQSYSNVFGVRCVSISGRIVHLLSYVVLIPW